VVQDTYSSVMMSTPKDTCETYIFIFSANAKRKHSSTVTADILVSHGDTNIQKLNLQINLWLLQPPRPDPCSHLMTVICLH